MPNLPHALVSTADSIDRDLRRRGFALLAPEEGARALALDRPALDALSVCWERLPRDEYLRDGGRYRYRRHGCYVQTFDPPAIERAPHRAHYQPTTYNALHGGIERWFEPLEPTLAEAPAFLGLMTALGERFARLRPVPRWHIEAHAFRIDTAEGIGRPTPEGAHRDGVDFVAIALVRRERVRGGETRVFDADGPWGARFLLEEPWTFLLLEDARVIHETTPIQPDGSPGVRDTLVLTYRASGFQSPEDS